MFRLILCLVVLSMVEQAAKPLARPVRVSFLPLNIDKDLNLGVILTLNVLWKFMIFIH